MDNPGYGWGEEAPEALIPLKESLVAGTAERVQEMGNISPATANCYFAMPTIF